MTTNQGRLGSNIYVDWAALLAYIALAIIGWINIYATVYDESHANIFDISQRYGMQMVWMGLSFCIGIAIMLVDDKYWHMLAYFIYGLAVLVLLAVLLGGTTVNGAKAWISIGSIRIQPAEFVKFATALALARYMSRYSFSMNNKNDLLTIAAIIGIPMIIIVLQNDTGSALVYFAFLLVLYREGMNIWVYVVLIMLAVLFILSLLLEPATLLIIMIGVCAAGAALSDGRVKDKLIFLAAIALGTTLIYLGARLIPGVEVSFYVSLLIASCVSVIPAIIYAYRKRISSIYTYVALFVVALAFTGITDYVFDNVLQLHQQKRILQLLGLETDLANWGYNVNQSKIAIGSGGLFGKGFLEGTQTKFDFVPEQSTDFIFSTLGEEWGFVGCAVVVSLFCILILRLIGMGERQREPFGRIYCYSVAALFFVHVVINTGMAIGIMPVIGIPLPFFSYGGSSFLAFSLMFFVALRLDSGKRELMRN